MASANRRTFRCVSPRGLLFAVFVAVVVLTGLEPAANAQPNVLTAHYGNTRQGYNGQESVLLSSTVHTKIAPASFSPLLVDLGPSSQLNAVFAQPLWVSSVSTSLTYCTPSCPMLLVATMGGGLYAFNAGDGTSSAGKTVWSRTTKSSGGAGTTNYFYYDDCGTGGGLASIGYGTSGLPFAGIIATPVIDTSGTVPVAYVTSLCQTDGTQGDQKWFIHKIDLTTGHDVVTSKRISGNVPGSLGADGVTTGGTCPAGQSCIPFTDWEVLQRPGLLEVSVTGVTHPLIYVAFGWGTVQENGQPYHGWILGYDDSLNQKFIFATTTKGTSDGSGTNTDKPSCSPTCSCGATSCSPSVGSGGTTCIVTGYNTAANWCGHAAGVWMGGNGGAAHTDSNGVSHAFFGSGNGSFQQYASDGATLLTPIQNWSQSVMDFTLSTSGYDTAPSQYFTPNGGVPVHESYGSGDKSFLGMNQNDFDTALSGILLLQDPLGTWRAVTIDKAGYGYLMTVGNLCGDSSSNCYPAVSQASGGKAGSRSGDPGNVFPFAANLTQCANQQTDDTCDRIASLAFYKDGSPKKLYVWAQNEQLTALQVSDGSTAVSPPSGTPQITWTSGSTTVTTSGTCTAGTNCLTESVIPGDTLIACGCTGTGCPTVVTVDSATSITISSAFPTSCTVPTSFQYSGYFLSPIRDVWPVGTKVLKPGGLLTATSNSGSDGLVWGLVTLTIGSPPVDEGTLLAYDAESLQLKWCSNTASVCDNSSSFALNASSGKTILSEPTVVNGYVYVPTWGINMTGGPSGSCTSTQCSGLIVYSGH